MQQKTREFENKEQTVRKELEISEERANSSKETTEFGTETREVPGAIRSKETREC